MDTAVYRIRYRKFWKRWLLASTIHRDWAWWASQEFLDTGFSRPLAPKLANASLTRLPFSQTSSTIWRIARFGMLINPPPSSLHILLLSTWQIIRDSLNTTSLSLLSSPCGRPRSEALKHARSGFRSLSIIDEHRMGYRSILIGQLRFHNWNASKARKGISNSVLNVSAGMDGQYLWSGELLTRTEGIFLESISPKWHSIPQCYFPFEFFRNMTSR